MDNAAEALFMGAAVLVFMVAVSLTLSSFSTFRNDLEDIILADERIDAAQYSYGNYINYISSSEECRTVGIDTLANSLFRVYKENYIVVLELTSANKINEYNAIKNYSVVKDFSNPIVQAGKDQLYPGETDPIIKNGDTILVFDIPTAKNDKEYINKILGDGLYNLLKDKTFIEYTGVYYEDDKVKLDTDLDQLKRDTTDDDPKFSVSVANKTKARIITYIEKK